MGVNVVNALFALDGQVVLFQGLPDALGLFGRTRQEAGVTVVRRVVALDEVADVDALGPRTGLKSLPRFKLLRLRCGCLLYTSDAADDTR